ncbi:MAG: DUF1573 domain-containing protein [Planctomycetota bacterium]|nr:MAG: DUF1573 domain-containing protein [Planctomycetota bacterium]
MLARVCLVAVCCLFASQTARAQAWAEKMFDHTSHDFGVVARGEKVEHVFTFRNLYLEDVHIASVRTSCGCTQPRYTTDVVKTYQTGQIVATVNTAQFTGRKDATLTVVFDRPFPAEVQLHTYVYIRSDVVFEPGTLQFGTVPQGTRVTRSVQIRYAGSPSWQIVSASARVPYLQPKLTLKSRAAGTVLYELQVTLTEDAPAGYLGGAIDLVTNDAVTSNRNLSVPVEGIIQPDLVVRPSELLLGELSPGQTVRKTIVIQARQPFAITEIFTPLAQLTAVRPETAKTVQVVPVTIAIPADASAGTLEGEIEIHTDHERHAVIRVPVVGEIKTTDDDTSSP